MEPLNMGYSSTRFRRMSEFANNIKRGTVEGKACWCSSKAQDYRRIHIGSHILWHSRSGQGWAKWITPSDCWLHVAVIVTELAGATPHVVENTTSVGPPETAVDRTNFITASISERDLDAD